MIITETKYENGDYMYEGSLTIEIETRDGVESCSFGRGEPEDFCIARDLSDVHNISNMLKMAYEAGKRGEDLELKSITEDE